MAELTPFIVETVVIEVFTVIVTVLSVYQVMHDFMEKEEWRPLVVCHYLMVPANIFALFQNVDPQAGLRIFTVSDVFMLGKFRAFFLIAAAAALAAGFIESHKLVTAGRQSPLVTKVLCGVHSLFFVICLSLFIALRVTLSVPLYIAVVLIIVIYSIVVGIQIFFSACKVRSVLVAERTRTGKYSEGIRKLTRLNVLVVIIEIIANVVILMALPDAFAQTEPTLHDAPPSSFSGGQIAGDVVGLIALYAIVMGGWNVKPKGGTKSRTSTGPSKSSSPRKSTRTIAQGGTEMASGTSGSTGSKGEPIPQTAVNVNLDPVPTSSPTSSPSGDVVVM